MRMRNKIKGFSLPGLLLSTFIIGLIAVVGFDIHVILKRSLIDQEARFTAVSLADSQLENLRETAKTTLSSDPIFTAGSNKATTLTIPANLNDFVVTYDVTDRYDFPEDNIPPSGPGRPWTDDNLDYKVITVKCTHPLYSGDTNEVQLRGALVE